MEQYEELNHLLIRLFSRIGKIEERAVGAMNENALTVGEVHTLEVIEAGEGLAMARAAEALGITAGTLTVSINRLVKKGFVDRRRDVFDHRVVKLHLTHEGKKVVRAHRIFHRKLIAAAVRGLDEEGILTLMRALGNMDEVFGSIDVEKKLSAPAKMEAEEAE